MFFIECDPVKQTKGKLDHLVSSIKKNMEGDKRGARVAIDQYGHYWQVTFAIEKPKSETFVPSIMDDSVESLTKSMESLQTKDEGRKRGAEDGEIAETKYRRDNIGGAIFETVIYEDDPILKAALRDTAAHFGLPPPPN